MKFFIQTLGCKVNQYESDKLTKMLEDRGHYLDCLEDADVFIINTCTVTHVADKKSRQMIRRGKRKNPKMCIVAMGCFVDQLELKEEKVLPIDLCIKNSQKEEAVYLIEKFMGIVQTGICEEHIQKGNIRTYLKIQDGCNQFCTYCIIPYVRGRSKSIPLEIIEREAVRLSVNHMEIVLTGIHISSYGKDLDENIGLEDVLFFM